MIIYVYADINMYIIRFPSLCTIFCTLKQIFKSNDMFIYQTL